MYNERSARPLGKTARKHELSAEKMCGDISKTTQTEMASTDWNLEWKWRKNPCAEDYPSAEELAAYLRKIMEAVE